MNENFREYFLECMAELLQSPRLGLGTPPHRKIYVNRGEGYLWYFLSADGKPDPIQEPAVTGKIVGFRVYQRKEGYKGSEPSKKIEVDLDCGQITYSIVFGFDATAGQSLLNGLSTAKLCKGDVVCLAVKAGNDEGGKVVLVDVFHKGEQIFPARDREIDSLAAAKIIAEDLGVTIELEGDRPSSSFSPNTPPPQKKTSDLFELLRPAPGDDVVPKAHPTLDQLFAEVRRVMKAFDLSLQDVNGLSHKLFKKPVKDLNHQEAITYVSKLSESLETEEVPF